MPITADPAAAPGLPEPSRRGFLRGLTTLPLIGGGVTLIGAPTAVAEPISTHLLKQYETWLGVEQMRVARELGRSQHTSIAFHGAAHDWHFDRERLTYRNGAPSTRAALVLATVGCDWREGGR